MSRHGSRSNNIDNDILLLLKQFKDLSVIDVSNKLKEKYNIKKTSRRFNLGTIRFGLDVLLRDNKIVRKHITSLKGSGSSHYIYNLKD